MNFDNDPDDESFRARARETIAAKLRELFPQPIAHHERQDIHTWTRAMKEYGWSTPHWPAEWGGAGWSAARRSILDEELVVAGAPPFDVIGIDFVAPVLYTFGTQAQKQRYLPKIASADEFWCQGFSEPNAGSDVMSLKTVAKPIGDDFLVTGQKLWTSNAHVADMMFALVRIDAPDAKRLRGLSFLLIDMKSPGIKVRPVITIDGRHIVNEVALDNVRVPGANLVGERGKGWEYARFLLANERTKAAGVAVVKRQVGLIRSLLKSERAVGRALAENAVYRSKLAQFEAELRALEFMELRLLSSRADQVQILAPMLKLRGSELKQRLSEFALELLGERALESPVEESQPMPVEGSALSAHGVRQCTSVFLYLRSATIVGGTSEIQRNIIAGMALGL